MAATQLNTATSRSATLYVVAYAKIRPKTKFNHPGIDLVGGTIHFGGLTHDHTEAEAMARECVNNRLYGSGATVLPKLFPMRPDQTLLDVLYDAQDKFEQIVEMMQESSERVTTRRS